MTHSKKNLETQFYWATRAKFYTLLHILHEDFRSAPAIRNTRTILQRLCNSKTVKEPSMQAAAASCKATPNWGKAWTHLQYRWVTSNTAIFSLFLATFQEWPQRHSYSGRVAASLPLPALVCRSNYRTCFAQTEFTTVHGQLLSCFSILLFGSNYQSQPSLVTFWLPPSFIPLASFPITEFTILRVCQGYSIFNSF